MGLGRHCIYCMIKWQVPHLPSKCSTVLCWQKHSIGNWGLAISPVSRNSCSAMHITGYRQAGDHSSPCLSACTAAYPKQMHDGTWIFFIPDSNNLHVLPCQTLNGIQDKLLQIPSHDYISICQGLERSAIFTQSQNKFLFPSFNWGGGGGGREDRENLDVDSSTGMYKGQRCYHCCCLVVAEVAMQSGRLHMVRENGETARCGGKHVRESVTVGELL